MPALPPWIQPADEVGATVQGYHIGAQLGAQQAAQRFQELQMARLAEQSAQQQARWEAEFGLQKAQQEQQAKEAAAKFEAQNRYAQAVQGGMDPLTALVQFGPQMGQNVGAVASAQRTIQAQERADERSKELPPPPEVAFAEVDGKRVPYLVDKKTGRGTWMPPGYVQNPKPVPRGTFTQADRDEIRDLERYRDRFQKLVDADEAPTSLISMIKSKPAAKLTEREKSALKEHELKRKRVDEIEKQIQAIRARARAGDNITAAASAGSTAQYRWDPQQKRVVKVDPSSDSGDDGNEQPD